MTDKPHFEENIHTRIRALVMYGECRLPGDQCDAVHLHVFYNHYEQVLEGLNLGYLPLVFDEEQKIFRLH
ncbi:MAG: hypothetical protein JWM96_1073, partial [Alphaproteobacteria bacterium]|nr:hypothetical protein [Alphaproteobacteria bacterium]